MVHFLSVLCRIIALFFVVLTYFLLHIVINCIISYTSFLLIILKIYTQNLSDHLQISSQTMAHNDMLEAAFLGIISVLAFINDVISIIYKFELRHDTKKSIIEYNQQFKWRMGLMATLSALSTIELMIYIICIATDFNPCFPILSHCVLLSIVIASFFWSRLILIGTSWLQDYVKIWKGVIVSYIYFIHLYQKKHSLHIIYRLHILA